MGASRELPPGTIGQYWSFVDPEDDAAELTTSFVEQGGSVILSPADVAYLDMKYVDDPQNALGHTLGLDWATGRPRSTRRTCGSRPRSCRASTTRDILGVEAPIWTETLATHPGRRVHGVPAHRRDRGDRVVAGAAAAARDTEAFFGRSPRSESGSTLASRTSRRGVPWAD